MEAKTIALGCQVRAGLSPQVMRTFDRIGHVGRFSERRLLWSDYFLSSPFMQPPRTAPSLSRSTVMVLSSRALARDFAFSSLTGDA
jgi:hypothetical protein